MKDSQANIHLTVCSKLWSLLQEDCDDKLSLYPCKQSWSSKMTSVGEERNWKQIEGTQTWWPFPVFLLLATVQEEAWESTTTSRAGASPGESSTGSPGHVIREPPREAMPCLPSPLEMVWKGGKKLSWEQKVWSSTKPESRLCSWTWPPGTAQIWDYLWWVRGPGYNAEGAGPNLPGYQTPKSMKNHHCRNTLDLWRKQAWLICLACFVSFNLREQCFQISFRFFVFFCFVLSF